MGVSEGFSKGLEMNMEQEAEEGQAQELKEEQERQGPAVEPASAADKYAGNYNMLAAPAEGRSIFG
jgi:hypothetical protein